MKINYSNLVLKIGVTVKENLHLLHMSTSYNVTNSLKISILISLTILKNQFKSIRLKIFCATI